MTEWLKLERLEKNNLQTPRYESDHSAGVDFSACLTRPCLEVPEGASFKETRPIICCEPTVTGSYYQTGMSNQYLSQGDGQLMQGDFLRKIKANKRFRVDKASDTWKDIVITDKPALTIYPGETFMVSVGFKIEFGPAYVLMLHVRSSVGLRGIVLANSTAIIDPDYRGELWAVLHNRNKHMPIIVEHGDRVVQGVMLASHQAVIKETTVDNTDRGEGGFGSTGINSKPA